MAEQFPSAITDLPPSAKLVYKILEYEDPLTYSEIVSETGLPESTVSDSLERLRNLDAVVRQHCPHDARMQIYSTA